MHSYEGKSAYFHFNSGLKDSPLHIIDKSTGKEIEIDANDVIALVAYEYVMYKKIGRLEQSKPEELLLGKE